MRKVIVLFVGLALVTAGCGTALLDAGPADTAAVLPGGVDFAADVLESYELVATVGYSSSSGNLTPFLGTDDDSASAIVLGIDYYFMGAVENDETPIGMQALLQRSSSVSLDLSLAGSYEPDPSGVDESDSFGYAVSATYIMGEDMVDGLGFAFTYGSTSYDAFFDGAPPAFYPNEGEDLSSTVLEVGAVYYLESISDSLEGVIAKLGYTKSEVDWDGDTSSLSGIEIGAEYYMEIQDGIWIDAEVSLGFLNRELDMTVFGFSIDDDDDAFAFGISATVYPMKALGVGIAFESLSQSDSDFDDLDSSTLGITASYSLDDQGLPLDLNIAYTSVGYGEGDWDTTNITFTVDYRF